jgi:hypothetical protein
MGDDERKNKGGEHQISLRSRSNGFPHKEERLIGRIVDLDLLSLFPQEDAIIIGGIKRKQDPKGQQWWGKTCSRDWGSLGKKSPLNRSPKTQPLQPKYVQGETSGGSTGSTANRYYQGDTGRVPFKKNLITASRGPFLVVTMVLARYYRTCKKCKQSDTKTSRTFASELCFR